MSVVATKASTFKKPRSSFRCGPVVIKFREVRRNVLGHTCSGTKAVGYKFVFRVSFDRKEFVDIALGIWASEEMDVATEHVESAKPALNRLEHGLRMGVEPFTDDFWSVELRQARISDIKAAKPWSKCFKASMPELNAGAGMDVTRALRRIGAIHIGSKAAVRGDSGRRRDFICAVFNESDLWPPVVAYVLTRVLPLWRGWSEADCE